MRRLVSGIIIAVLLSCILVLAIDLRVIEVKAPNGNSVHNLDTGLNYTTIQEAINANETLNGHTIFVGQGTYYEHVVVNKSLAVIGENRSTTIVEGEGTDTVFNVTTSGISLTNFTIQNCDTGISMQGNGNTIRDNMISYCFSEAISCISSNNKIIRNTLWENTLFGIAISYGSNNNFTGNVVGKSHFGIYLWESPNNFFKDNEMVDNNHNFGVYAQNLTGYVQNVDASNNVDGKPIGYFVNSANLMLNATTFPEIGYLGLVNCTRITVSNLTLSDNVEGLLIAYTTNSFIENMSFHNNEDCIVMRNCANNTIIRNTMSWDFYNPNSDGVLLYNSSENILGWNTISECWMGIYGWSSHRNLIEGNNLAHCERSAIHLSSSEENVIMNNKLVNNLWSGIDIINSGNCKIYHNSFINSTARIDNLFSSKGNIWDDGYPSGGNYWSGYTGVDLNHDGIGDTSHVIDTNNTDHYPLMGIFHSFNTSLAEHVNVISNSTIESFEYFESNGTITIHVSNMTIDQTHGFCRVCIPHVLMSEPFNVTIDGVSPTYWNYTLHDNGTHRWIYFEYEHSTREIVIIPEFPSPIVLLLFMITTLLATIIARKRSQWRRSNTQD